MSVCVYVCLCVQGTHVEKEVRGCVSVRKWRGQEEGWTATAGPPGDRATGRAVWHRPRQSLILTETPQVWPDLREAGQNPSETPGKLGAAWASLPQALRGLGLARGQAVTVWLGTSWLQISGRGSLSPRGKGELWAE